MAINAGTGAVGGNSQNIPEAHVPRTSSKFDLKAHRLNTERYGEYTPIIAFESVKEDKLPVRLAHQLLSYTMKKPLMQDVQKVKDLFSVPMESILPLNWEKFYDNPVRGDDVANDVGPTIENFWNKVGSMMQSFLSALQSILSNSNTSDVVALQSTLRFLVIGEYFYSNGSLMSTLGCHGSPYCSVSDGYLGDISWDRMFDKTISTILNDLGTATLQVINPVSSYGYRHDHIDYDNGFVPFRHFLNIMRDDPTAYIDLAYDKTSTPGVIRTSLNTLFAANTGDFLFSFSKANVPFNTQFLSAYQLCCAHYYTNDHIDFCYSAELFRQLIGHYLTYFSSYSPNFIRNGISYQFDYLSAHALSIALYTNQSYQDGVLKVTTANSGNNPSYRATLGLLSSIFAFRRSLKYLDYFSGSRTQPLAVGSTNVSVSNNSVSVIDITRNIQRQRFLNSVNRIAHSFEGYLKGVFGGRMPSPDYHNPFHLANTIDTVYGDETANTGDAQISANADPIAITTNLRGNSNKYMFEIDSDRPCVIIAITHYDLPRVHTKSIDRSFFHVDRFDYFNPFMQYTGDQPIYLNELGIQTTLQTTLNTFSYTLRHMEYKQLYNTASGGFVENLPGFAFHALDKRGTAYNITPEWIRCVQSELDEFYTSLTGYSLGSYFHFIVDNFVDCSGTRPMAFAPQILG